MNDRILNLSKQLFSVKDQSEIETILMQASHFLGMDGYTFFYVTAEREVILLDTRPEDFLAYYQEREWLMLDPVVQTAMMQSRPILWNRDVTPKTATQKVIYYAGSDIGIRDGFIFQAREGLEQAGISFYSQTIAKSTTDAFLEQETSLRILIQSLLVVFKDLHQSHELDGEKKHPMTNHDLTGRELEILHLMSEGMQNREIASRLHLSPETIKEHVGSIAKKLNSRNRAHSVALGFKRNILLY